mmetsp:Transcript_37247/g.90399  ORF Transcript_37247/g.90399 Transcript_37247/m.90399 type:complete len:89 (+) Transcript_37247:2615-2881(+)
MSSERQMERTTSKSRRGMFLIAILDQDTRYDAMSENLVENYSGSVMGSLQSFLCESLVDSSKRSFHHPAYLLVRKSHICTTGNNDGGS